MSRTEVRVAGFRESDNCYNGKWLTLKRVPMEENLDCFDVSSGSGGKRLATNGHLDAFSRA